MSLTVKNVNAISAKMSFNLISDENSHLRRTRNLNVYPLLLLAINVIINNDISMPIRM